MRRNCYSCGYCIKKNHEYYCNDLDTYVDPFEPECSDENYYS